MLIRRRFIQGLAGGGLLSAPWNAGLCWSSESVAKDVTIDQPLPGEDVFSYVRRQRGRHDEKYYAQVLGAANPFKESDQQIGVAAADDTSRTHARTLLANTQIADVDTHPLHRDHLYQFISGGRSDAPGKWLPEGTLDDLKKVLLSENAARIKQHLMGLSSDVIACVVKLMSNDELIGLGAKVFNPLPGSHIGAEGYLGARLQPNSPTDHPDDIFWQVLSGWSFSVGDVLLGTNPVSSDPESVFAIQNTLSDLLETFGVQHLMPHCVLAHIDVQAEVEREHPGSTKLWFQSIAGSDAANQTFDISVAKMREYAASRDGRYGLYFETGQGADFTNGHSHGFDMVMHESRKYGFARALSLQVGTALQIGTARGDAGMSADPWVHLNDVAGFIGPEVFRSRKQLVRCCLEDIVMGKLHGLCIGLDVCSTLHMDISLDDLDWCLDQIMPANPAYLMALPTKIDPMLGYLTTSFQDHVRLRRKYDYRVNDPMWDFFQSLEVIDSRGEPTAHFGDPLWLFLKYRRRKNDGRDDSAILAEGQRRIAEVRKRGVFIAQGYGSQPWDLPSGLKNEVTRIYDDAKLSIWAEMNDDFISSFPNGLALATRSSDRADYILHPTTGELLNESSAEKLQRLRQRQAGQYDVQIVISDGLNALAITEEGHLPPFLGRLSEGLSRLGLRASPELLIVRAGRVRAGYRIGEALFANLTAPRTILHVIGERPGTGHRTFSTYITVADGNVWSSNGTVDHNITKVVSGIATSATKPTAGADEVIRILGTLV